MGHAEELKSEFGDFQTPLGLARAVCSIIAGNGFQPRAVVEPTCGQGSFVQAAVEAFPNVSVVLGIDRNPAYVEQALSVASDVGRSCRVQILQGDFFEMNWSDTVATLPEPILVLGNPPWVTNSTLGARGGSNHPKKRNHDRLRGIDALTGKSNFDISEWMLRKGVEWLSGSSGMLAVLCKSAVARRVLLHAWSRNTPIETADMRRIDSQSHFGVSVDACLLLIRFNQGARSAECRIYSSLEANEPEAVIGFRNGTIVSNPVLYDRYANLLGHGLSGWRSGVKHDCSAVFELVPKNGGFENGFGASVTLESDVTFPLLKSSDLARRRCPRKWLLVPQRSMGASPESLQYSAPIAWQYLCAHGDILSKRASSIYRNRPRFSIFGIGDYSFAPWKIAISGLYKGLDFVRVPPHGGRPVLLDDTCYFFPCHSERECDVLYELVLSKPAQDLWSALVFWDAKRPITAQVLNSIDISAVARAAGIQSDAVRTLSERQRVRYAEGGHQHLLFVEKQDDPTSATTGEI